MLVTLAMHLIKLGSTSTYWLWQSSLEIGYLFFHTAMKPNFCGNNRHAAQWHPIVLQGGEASGKYLNNPWFSLVISNSKCWFRSFILFKTISHSWTCCCHRLGGSIFKATYNLEGDGPPNFTGRNWVCTVTEAVRVAHTPNTEAVIHDMS